MVMVVRTVLQDASTIKVTVELSQDARFEFPCSAQSDDSTPLSVRWYRVDQETGDEIAVRVIPDKLLVTTNGSLIIQLAKNDSDGWGRFHGQYKCRASNLYSEAVREAFIHVNNYVQHGQYHPATISLSCYFGFTSRSFAYFLQHSGYMTVIYAVRTTDRCVFRGHSR